jgi:anti-sigma factor RsiW
MNCPFRSEDASSDFSLLLDYTAGRLDSQRTAMLDRHMDNCADCAALRVEQAAVWDTLDAWEPMPASIDFNRRLWQRIGAMESAPWYERLAESMRMAHWKPAFTLAGATLIIAAGFMLDHPGGRVPVTGGSSTAGVSVTEAEQVEQTLEDLQLLHQFDSATADVSNVSKQM